VTSGEKADLSLVMPCYNEEEAIGYTIPQLLGAFEGAGHALELVAVDNGSTDRTGEILADLAARHPSVVVHRVDVNVGYGNGILEGLARARAPWVGTICADGQVDAEDVVRLYEALATTSGPVLGKVRRRFRMDGLRRKVTSIAYNAFVVLLWPGIGSIDINGVPKITRHEIVEAMNLQSRQWFLDPEIMIKAHYLGVRVLEMNVFSRMRGNGLSHVRASTCWEFFRDLLRHRFAGALREWRASLPAAEEPQRVR
jgi:glycosyltransferase involved in cell wall biosynthesis